MKHNMLLCFILRRPYPRASHIMSQLQEDQWIKNLNSLEGNGSRLIRVTGKVTFHPRTGHMDPERVYRCRYTLSLTSDLDGVGGQRHASAALSPRKRPGPRCTEGSVDKRTGLDECGKSVSYKYVNLCTGLLSSKYDLHTWVTSIFFASVFLALKTH